MSHVATLPPVRLFIGPEDFGCWAAEAVLAIQAGGVQSCNHFAKDEGTRDDFRAAMSGSSSASYSGHPLDWAFDRTRLASRIIAEVAVQTHSPNVMAVWGRVRMARLSLSEAARRVGVVKSTAHENVQRVDRLVEEVLYKHGRLMPRWRAVHVAPNH